MNIYTYLEVYRPFRFWNIPSENADLVALLLRNRGYHGNHFVPHSLGVVLMLASNYKLDMTTQYRVIAIFIRIRYVTLRCDLDLCPFDLGIISRDATWVVNSAYQVWTGCNLNVPELRRLQFSIDRQLSPNFYFFSEIKGVKFQI